MTSDFEPADGLAVFHPVGEATLEQGIAMVTEAIAAAREQGLPKLVVDLSDLSGFDEPTMGQRYALAKQWADASGGSVMIAVVVAARFIDRDKIGVDVAFNRGVLANTFADKQEAIAWLKAQD